MEQKFNKCDVDTNNRIQNLEREIEIIRQDLANANNYNFRLRQALCDAISLVQQIISVLCGD